MAKLPLQIIWKEVIAEIPTPLGLGEKRKYFADAKSASGATPPQFVKGYAFDSAIAQRDSGIGFFCEGKSSSPHLVFIFGKYSFSIFDAITDDASIE